MFLRYKNILLFLLFLAITFVLYSGTLHSKFVFDFIDWFFTYQQQGWRGLLHSFNDPSLHHVYHLFFFCAVKVFGTNNYAWYILFCGLHTLNGFLLFVVLKSWLEKNQTPYFFETSVFAALLFLISPYQTEVVVWGATIHYLLVVCFALLVLNLTFSFARTDNKKYLLGSYFLFFIGLFTHEIIIVLPAIAGIMLWVVYPSKRFKLLLKIVLPQLTLIATYFFLNKVILEKWVGHYGAQAHLQFDWWQLQTAFAKYFCKYFLFAQFLSDAYKNHIYMSIENHHYRVLLSFVLVIVLLAVAWNKKSVAPKLVLALFAISFIALFPVLNLYFPNWINIQADRLGYFASLFLYSFFAVTMVTVFRKFGFVLLSGFLCMEAYALHQNTNSWKQAGILIEQLENNFPKDTTKHYYILNLPDNYQGAYMFRCLGDSKFATTLKLKTQVDRTSQITEVLSYNLQQPTDSVKVSIVDSLKLKVELSNAGSWWWRYTVGATDYEDENVNVDIDDSKHFYTVSFKKKRKEDVFLYQAGGDWREVNFFR